MLIVTLVLACLALTQGKSIAGLLVLDQPTATAMHDACADPNDGGGGDE